MKETPNIQHRTLNAQPAARLPCWTLDVRCSAFDVWRAPQARCALCACLLLCAGISSAVAQAVTNYAVQVSAAVQTNPPQITLSWVPDSPDYGYSVNRRVPGEGWGAGISLPPNATSDVDSNVVPGLTCEYAIFKDFTNFFGEGFVSTGIEVPLTENRGSVVLLVDDAHASSLALELGRLQQDLVGDGWSVIRHDVSRTDSVTNIKALILADYNADPANVQAVFLFGHVPVPYSGNLNPDGHADHKGAWPADVYYGTTDDGRWTDTSVNTTTASDPRNRNVPGDGKFDQTEVPATVAFQVGRVDFANLPAFPQSERDLLRRYLNKDHNFRHARLPAPRRGLIDDHFGVFGREAFAVNGWRNFAPLCGPTNVVAGDWLTTLSTRSYLWGYGCGAGTYTSASGVTSTSDLAGSDPRVVFTMLFGSYFGDWDSPNNLLRAALATPTYTLTCAWVGRPYWYVHHMALGETIGYSARACQNGAYGFTESVGLYQVHVALMGDPTLRMHPVAPPSALVIAMNVAGGAELSWSASPDTVLGYHVYRAPTAAGPFTRLNAELLNGTNYSDSVAGTNTYMVRAVKLEVTPSGSYYNASQGIFQDLRGTFNPPALSIRLATNTVILSWPATFVSLDYRLEATSSLSSPNWSSVTNSVQTSDGVNTFTVATERSGSFYRLAQP